MRHPENLYEDNPNKYEGGVLRINRLKKNVSIKLTWNDVNGKYHTEYFVPNTPHYVENYHDVPDFHICENVENAVRKFMTHCPIHEIQIEPWRTE